MGRSGGLKGRRRGPVLVRVDGVERGRLSARRLPAGLEPVWFVERRRLPKRPGEPWRYLEDRVPRYRMIDYLGALGVRVADIQRIHVLGPRGYVAEVSGEQLRQVPEGLMFRFASDTHGKPLPMFRAPLSVNTTFDNFAAIDVYVDEAPPALTKAGKLAVAPAPAGK